MCEKMFYIKELFKSSIKIKKNEKEQIDFCHHRCKLSINIIGQTKERENSQGALQVCMSNEAKEIFSFFSPSLSHSIPTIRYKENTINTNNCLLRSSLVFCSCYFLCCPE
jgi:hypothetical protein